MKNPQAESNNHNPQAGRGAFSRRDFLKIGITTTAAGGAALAIKGLNASRGAAGRATAAGPVEEHIAQTTCAMCPSGCGLDVRVVNGKAVKVEGNALHPLNQGVCCLRGHASLEMLYSPERLRHPRRQLGPRGSGDWEEISWDEALSLVAGKLGELRSAGLAHTVAWMQGETRGQMRAVVNRFWEAYGSPNVISQESLGEGAARLAMWLTQGVNTLPVYDFNNANYVVAFGGNLLESSRHLIAYLGSLAFMRRGRPQRGKLVAVHPRLSLTGVKADEWVPIRPGTYGALALGMANVIINSGLYDEDFVRNHTFGFEDFEDEAGNPRKGFKSLVLETYTLERVASMTGIPAEDIARIAGEFATNRPAVAVLPTEPAELASGNSLYTAMAVHVLNALVGSIDQSGGVLVQRFPEMAEWPAYRTDDVTEAGQKIERLDGAGTSQYPLAFSLYQQMADRILSDRPYPVNALFLYNANPVYELPQEGKFVQALMKVPFVVSFANTLDESAAHADLVLPAGTFFETWGDDFMEGTGYAGVSLRRPVVEPVQDVMDIGEVLLQIARRLGGPAAEALPFEGYRDLIEHRLSGIRMDWEKFLENGWWSEMVYFNAQPGSPAWTDVVGRDRLNAPKDGRFDFYSRELAALFGPQTEDLDCLPHFEVPVTLQEADTEYPFLLVSQSLITNCNTWQGVLPSLQETVGLQTNVRWDSWVELSPQAAEELGIHADDEVWIESPAGKVKAIARIYPGLWPNAVYMPPGQGHNTLVRWGRNAPEKMVVGVNANQLSSVGTESLSGQAVYNPARVKIYKA